MGLGKFSYSIHIGFRTETDDGKYEYEYNRENIKTLNECITRALRDKSSYSNSFDHLFYSFCLRDIFKCFKHTEYECEYKEGNNAIHNLCDSIKYIYKSITYDMHDDPNRFVNHCDYGDYDYNDSDYGKYSNIKKNIVEGVHAMTAICDYLYLDEQYVEYLKYFRCLSIETFLTMDHNKLYHVFERDLDKKYESLGGVSHLEEPIFIYVRSKNEIEHPIFRAVTDETAGGSKFKDYLDEYYYNRSKRLNCNSLDTERKNEFIHIVNDTLMFYGQNGDE